MLALVTEVSKKRLFDIFHLAFLSILLETAVFYFLLYLSCLILSDKDWLKGSISTNGRLPIIFVAIEITSYHIISGVLPDVYGQKD